MKFYRYETIQYASLGMDGEYVSSPIPNPTLQLIEYDMLKETPKGYWIGFGGFGYDKYNWKKWVSKTSVKRYAYPTKEEALQNFIKRTERRIKIMKYQLLSCEIGLGKAKNIKL